MINNKILPAGSYPNDPTSLILEQLIEINRLLSILTENSNISKPITMYQDNEGHTYYKGGGGGTGLDTR